MQENIYRLKLDKCNGIPVQVPFMVSFSACVPCWGSQQSHRDAPARHHPLIFVGGTVCTCNLATKSAYREQQAIVQGEDVSELTRQGHGDSLPIDAAH